MKRSVPQAGTKRMSVADLLDGTVQKDTNKAGSRYAEDEVIQDDTFSYDGYQVVRGEFFAHIYEPSLCFNQSRVYVNMGCLKRMQDVDYVQILVNAEEKKLVIRPAGEDEKAHSCGAVSRMLSVGPNRSPAGYSSPRSSI